MDDRFYNAKNDQKGNQKKPGQLQKQGHTFETTHPFLYQKEEFGEREEGGREREREADEIFKKIKAAAHLPQHLIPNFDF